MRSLTHPRPARVAVIFRVPSLTRECERDQSADPKPAQWRPQTRPKRSPLNSALKVSSGATVGVTVGSGDGTADGSGEALGSRDGTLDADGSTTAVTEPGGPDSHAG